MSEQVHEHEDQLEQLKNLRSLAQKMSKSGKDDVLEFILGNSL